MSHRNHSILGDKPDAGLAVNFVAGVIAGFVILTGCYQAEAISSPATGTARSSTASSTVSTEVSSSKASSSLDGITSVALPEPVGALLAAQGAENTLFEPLGPEQTGIDFVHEWIAPEEYLGLMILGPWKSGGVCIADYDGDGRSDVYLARPQGGNRLYHNVGDFRFEDVTDQAGLADDAWGTGVTFADVDGDGDLDLYACGFDCPNRLYINQGDGTFKEIAKQAGLDFAGSSMMMAFADYDQDGDLDAYLVTNRLAVTEQFDINYVVRRGRKAVPEKLLEVVDLLYLSNGKYKQIKAAQYDHLYRNNGDGTFTDVSEQAGIRGNYFGLSATWWDANDDGFADLYVTNDFYGPDHLYRNNGDGTFTDIAREALPHTPWYSMGADFADLNNDGRFDLMGSDMSSTTHYKSKVSMGDMAATAWFMTYAEPRQYMRNAVYVNTGTDRFMEVAQMAGIASTDWTWAVKFADMDNDGWVDLFITNGMDRHWNDADLINRLKGAGEPGNSLTSEARRIMDEAPQLREKNIAYRNKGDFRFENTGSAWGLDREGISHGAAFGDLDGDGDLDLVVINYREPVSVYRNTSTDSHRVKIRLRGTRSNRHGVGATARLENAAGVQVRYLTLARGFTSANEPLVHFGLGAEAVIDRLTIEWPSGHVQTFDDLAADRFYTITEPEGEPVETSPSEADAAMTMFARSERFTWPYNEHQELEFDDFKRQPLLPNKLSQLGPGMAWGDVDGDGRDDLYVGAAAGQAPAIHLSTPEGAFRSSTPAVFNADRACEDMAPLFFDADGDGDLDLYVVSGGVECEPGDEVLRDRLYLGDGSGNFTKATDALPDLRDSGSVVVASDFDRDGDLDLFVGGRVIPGEYPLAPRSRILQNNGGQFTDVTESVAPSLATTGLVTGAIWSDADDDGWLDLLVTHEWGPVKLFHNDRGRLVDQTDGAGLAERLGWWNSIAGRDLDGDGDVDYVVTNFGLNTRYHATAEHPVRLFYGDLDGSGVRHLIEADYEGDTLYPVRGKSCSTNAMPSLAEKFTTFNAFALASLDEIYTDDRLKKAEEFQINTLESGVLLNDGTGRFTFAALPRLAQASPGFGVVLTEVDGDGHADIYVAQNFFSPQAKTGRMDGGLSLLLKGAGDGTFAPVWPHESGLVVPGDAKGLTAADLNADGWVDFIIGINDGELITYEHRGSTVERVLTVRLSGRSGNQAAIGSRVTLERSDGHRQTAEVHAGSGYLSQSPATLTFGLGATHTASTLTIRWPDGTTTTTTPTADKLHVLVRQQPRAAN